MNVHGILVPVDFSDVARAAVDAALYFARRFDASVRVVHVIPPTPHVDRMHEDSTKLLEAFVERADARGVVVSGGVEVGPPVSTIIELAECYGLVVMGTRRRAGVAGEALGVAEKVVRAARSPVLVVHLNEVAQTSGVETRLWEWGGQQATL